MNHGFKTLQVSISEGIPNGFTFVDIGQLSASMFTRIIKRMHMIFWLGTTGNGQVDYERSVSANPQDNPMIGPSV